MKHAQNTVQIPKESSRVRKRIMLGALVVALVAAALGAFLWFSAAQEQKRAEEEAALAQAQQAFAQYCEALDNTIAARAAEANKRLSKEAAEAEAAWLAILSEDRQAAIEAARQAAIEEAHEAAIEAARVVYEEEVEAERQRRASSFGDVLLVGDSVMEYATSSLYAQLPGAAVNAMGGRTLETGPLGTNFDPSEGVLDQLRNNAGVYARYVVGTGNNEGSGMGMASGEEIVQLLSPADIYFITQMTNANHTSMEGTNATIEALCERYENVHKIDWHGLCAGREGELLMADGVHPLAAGIYEYVQLIHEELSSYNPPPFNPESVEFDPESVEFDPTSVFTGPELTDSIMGESIISAASMVQLYNSRGVAYPSATYKDAGAATIEDFCKLCAEEAKTEGVRAEVLFAQAMHETAWLQFGNQVGVEQNNFGGLGAVNSGGAGESFSNVRTGLRAQVQHLKAYASTEELNNECVDPRFNLVERGSAPTVFDLGGRWAWPGDGYGQAIMNIVRDLYEIEYPVGGRSLSDKE